MTPPRPVQPPVPPPVPGRAAGGAAPAERTALRARRRATGASVGALPVANLVVLELGLAVGLVLLAVDRELLPVASGILGLALLVALIRWRGRWLTQWITLTTRYLLRSHIRVARPTEPPEISGVAAEQAAAPGASTGAASTAGPASGPASAGSTSTAVGSAVAGSTSTAAGPASATTVTGPEDLRVALLRLAVPDLVVARGTDHERRPVGLAWHEGSWTAALLVEPPQALVQPLTGVANLPLGALAPTLEDRGVVLDSIGAIWHCYPGSGSLPPSAPALESYLEVLGPLPATARRTAWVVVRLDPRRCPAAVRERGGGVVGAHRALIGALSRVRSALDARGVQTRPLDVDELLRAGITAAELQSVTGSPHPVALRERWTGVTAGGVGHASYAVTGWPSRARPQSLNALTGVRALSATVALFISPSGEPGKVGLRGLVRVSARTPAELESADERMRLLGSRLGVRLTPLRGLQLAGLAATLPLGGSA